MKTLYTYTKTKNCQEQNQGAKLDLHINKLDKVLAESKQRTKQLIQTTDMIIHERMIRHELYRRRNIRPAIKAKTSWTEY